MVGYGWLFREYLRETFALIRCGYELALPLGASHDRHMVNRLSSGNSAHEVSAVVLPTVPPGSLAITEVVNLQVVGCHGMPPCSPNAIGVMA